MKKILIAMMVMCSISAFAQSQSQQSCDVGVYTFDSEYGKFRSETIELIKEDLNLKGYNVVLVPDLYTNARSVHPDLLLEVYSGAYGIGMTRAPVDYEGHDFEARFIFDSNHKIYAKAEKRVKIPIRHLVDISLKKKKKLFLEVTEELLAKIPTCEELR